MKWRELIALNQLPNVGLAYRSSFNNGSTENAALVFHYQDKVYAYLNQCPHLGLELDWLPGEVFDLENANLMCATHGARFDPQSGLCISGPCVGQTMVALKLKILDGVVYVQEP